MTGRLLAFLSILCLPLHAADDAVLNLDARSLDFDGKQITLTGEVALQHPLGQLCAERASVVQAPPDEDYPFSRVQLFKKVHVKLREGGELKCDRADLNYNNLTGVIRGCRGSGARVALPYHSRTGAVPVSLQGETIHFDLLPVNGSPYHLIGNVVAQGEVHIQYGQELKAVADQAIYRQTNLSTVKLKDLTGNLFLLPHGQQGTCKISRGEHEAIQAQLIRIEANPKNLHFQKPKGKFSFTSSQGIFRELTFEADQLDWKDEQGSLCLDGNVHLRDPLVGDLYASDHLEMYLDDGYQGRGLRNVRTEGPTFLVLKDPSGSEPRTLSARHGMEIDSRRCEIAFRKLSPTGTDRQVCYQDRTGQVHADEAIVRYQHAQGSWSIQDIRIEGNVFLFNQSQESVEGSNPSIQYAKADSLKIIPGQNLLVLSGKGHRVLFFDKTNNVQVSAPAVEMSRNGKTGKDAVRGVGDVRLQFIGEELDNLLEEAKQVAESSPSIPNPAA